MNFKQAVIANKAECPPIETVAALASGGLSEDAAAATLAHIGNCPHCDAEFSMAARCLADATAEQQAAEDANVALIAARLQKKLPFRHRSWWQQLLDFSPRVPTGIAAACAMLALVAYVGQRPVEPGLDPTASPGAVVLRSSSVELIAPAGDLAAAPAQFEWQPVAGADRYVFELLEVDGNVLFRGETESTRLAMPVAAGRHIVPAKTLLWKVTAFRGGSEVATSSTQRFRMKP